MLRSRAARCQDRHAHAIMRAMRQRPLYLRAPLLLLVLLQLSVQGAAAWADARLGEGTNAPAHLESHSTDSCPRVHPSDCAFHRLLITPVTGQRAARLRIRAGRGIRWTIVVPDFPRSFAAATLHDSRAPPPLS
jgi:hypothetical protein